MSAENLNSASLEGNVLWRAGHGFSGQDRLGPARWISGQLRIVDGHIVELNEQKTSAAAPWIIPGLVDVHCHLSVTETGPADIEQSRESAKQNLHSGVLTIREPGGPNVVDHSVGTAIGLRVLLSGRHLALRKRYLPGMAIELESPAELPSAVVHQAMIGDGWVKLVGDWIDRTKGADSDLEPLWDREILIDAVAAAHEVGARVAVHTFSRSAIDDLLIAKVDSIEHGSGMTREHMDEAASQGIPVTPTLGQVEIFPQFAQAAGRKYPRYAQTMSDLYGGRQQWFVDLLESGVQLLPGTDAGGYQPHGDLVGELERWAAYGATETQIIDYATWRALDFLGEPTLSRGVPASFVVLDDDPTISLKPLREPQEIWIDGQAIG